MPMAFTHVVAINLEPWSRKTELQVPMMKDNAGRRAFTEAIHVIS